MDLGRTKEEVCAPRAAPPTAHRPPPTAQRSPAATGRAWLQEKLAVCRKYFIGGFFLLPWLWCVLSYVWGGVRRLVRRASRAP